MHDRPFILAALAGFLALATFPVWYNVAAGTRPAAPDLVLPRSARVCVASRDYMRASHMNLLVSWREDVVRRGDRSYQGPGGQRYEKSFTGTCLRCHDDRAKFCDRCHDYAGVKPACIDCHVTVNSQESIVNRRARRPLND